jgi:hypothetical protein
LEAIADKMLVSSHEKEASFKKPKGHVTLMTCGNAHSSCTYSQITQPMLTITLKTPRWIPFLCLMFWSEKELT